MDRVWNYVSRFSDWIPYQHRVKATVQDFKGNFKSVPVPPNQVKQDLFRPISRIADGYLKPLVCNVQDSTDG